MGLVLNKWWTNKDFHSLSVVSDNPHFFDNGKCMGEYQHSVSLKSIIDGRKKNLKKKIKFSDSYFQNFLDSIDDATEATARHEMKIGESKTYFCSPYLKSKMIRENIRKVYSIGKWLGSGQFGSVRVASPYTNMKQKFAIKSVPRGVSEDYLRQLEKEFRILKEVDHPNIIKFFESYQDQKYFHFVVEYCDGGELYDLVSKKGRLDEWETARIIKKLCSAIAHLHDRDICHRDLKPENILFESKSPDAEIKLIDFGLSTYARKGRIMRTRVGTPFYVAPEVLYGEYQKSCDMWSIGVIAYVLLWGYPPFYGDDNEEIFQKIETVDFNYPVEDWASISPIAKDFINKLLVSNPKKRMTPYEAMNHSWLDISWGKSKIDIDVISKLKSFKHPNRLLSEILLFLSNFTMNQEVKRIRETFEAIDIDFSGWISIEELKEALKDSMECEEIEELMDSIDLDKNGEINYSEFLAATLDRKIFESEETVQTIFNHFDTKNAGIITADSLLKAFQRSSKWYTVKFVQEMLFEFTGKYDITFKEFQDLLLKW